MVFLHYLGMLRVKGFNTALAGRLILLPFCLGKPNAKRKKLKSLARGKNLNFL